MMFNIINMCIVEFPHTCSVSPNIYFWLGLKLYEIQFCGHYIEGLKIYAQLWFLFEMSLVVLYLNRIKTFKTWFAFVRGRLLSICLKTWTNLLVFSFYRKNRIRLNKQAVKANL